MAKKSVVCNCDYNMTKQLSKKLQFAWNIDQYIKDAQKSGHKDCAALWKKIKADEERHAKMLNQQVKKKIKSGEFC